MASTDDKDTITITQAQITADREHLRSLSKCLLNTQDLMERAERAYRESLELLRRVDRS